MVSTLFAIEVNSSLKSNSAHYSATCAVLCSFCTIVLSTLQYCAQYSAVLCTVLCGIAAQYSAVLCTLLSGIYCACTVLCGIVHSTLWCSGVEYCYSIVWLVLWRGRVGKEQELWELAADESGSGVTAIDLGCLCFPCTSQAPPVHLSCTSCAPLMHLWGTWGTFCASHLSCTSQQPCTSHAPPVAIAVHQTPSMHQPPPVHQPPRVHLTGTSRALGTSRAQPPPTHQPLPVHQPPSVHQCHFPCTSHLSCTSDAPPADQCHHPHIDPLVLLKNIDPDVCWLLDIVNPDGNF